MLVCVKHARGLRGGPLHRLSCVAEPRIDKGRCKASLGESRERLNLLVQTSQVADTGKGAL